jgi:hypothetical protein
MPCWCDIRVTLRRFPVFSHQVLPSIFLNGYARPKFYDISTHKHTSTAGRRLFRACSVMKMIPSIWENLLLWNWQHIGALSGFHQVALRLSPNGLRPQGLKEYSDSCSISDYLGPVFGSKCLVTQTTGDYFGLRPSEESFRLPPRLSIHYIVFLICILIGLTSLASIYSQTPVLF